MENEILERVARALENGNDVYIFNSDNFSRNTMSVSKRKREVPTDVFISQSAIDIIRQTGQFSSELQVCHVGQVGENSANDIQIGDIVLVEFNSDQNEIAVIDVKSNNDYWENAGVGLTQIEKRALMMNKGLPLLVTDVVRLSKGIPPSLKRSAVNLATL